MIGTLFEFLKPKLLKLSVYIVLAFLFGTTIKAIYFPSRYEIVYDYKIAAFSCLNSKTCFYIGELMIANTGSVSQNNVEVTITNLPQVDIGKPSVLDLSATEPRKTDPDIRLSDTEMGHQIHIDKFMPGALIKFHLNSLMVPKAEVNRYLKPHITVSSEGQNINADPRGTKLLRIWSIFF
jgi:hypothetical protein